MARIRAPLGLLVYPTGWGGNYNPSLDPIVPMESGPITYDMITGYRTTNSIPQQTIRENYPVDWSGGIGRISRIPRAALGQTDIYTPASATTSSVSPAPVVTPIDTSNLPVESGTVATLESTLPPAVLAGSQAPSQSQLSSVISQGTNSGLTPTQISAIITAAAGAGVSVLKATSSPYTIPGTSLVYNPATGQISSATGLTSSALAATSIASSFMPMILLGGGLLLLVMMMSMGRR